MYPKIILREREPHCWEKCDTHFFKFFQKEDILRRAVAHYLAFGDEDGCVIQIKHYIFIW